MQTCQNDKNDVKINKMTNLLLEIKLKDNKCNFAYFNQFCQRGNDIQTNFKIFCSFASIDRDIAYYIQGLVFEFQTLLDELIHAIVIKILDLLIK